MSATSIHAVAERLLDLWESTDWEPIGIFADVSGLPILLEVEKLPGGKLRDASAFVQTHASGPQHYRIRHQLPDQTRIVTLPETYENYHHVQPLVDHYLVVRGRTTGQSDLNAHVFDLEGQPVRSFFVGDAIEDVQTSPQGQIWVSYFDQGSANDLRTLAGFQADGTLFFRPDSGSASGYLDCYALNVVGDDDVWFYPHPGFPLIHLVGGNETDFYRDFPVQGSSGFAVWDQVGLFGGGYDAHSKVFHVDLNTREVRRMQIADEVGEAIASLRTFGRGPQLFVTTHEGLYTVDLRKL